ncbi:MAG: 30S ribosomal protein S9 [Candidatus Hodgkinia cicadicola]
MRRSAAQAYALRAALVKCVLGLTLKWNAHLAAEATPLLTAVEHKQYGSAKARKSFQFSKR